jgi:hypothetical protein
MPNLKGAHHRGPDAATSRGGGYLDELGLQPLPVGLIRHELMMPDAGDRTRLHAASAGSTTGITASSMRRSPSSALKT